MATSAFERKIVISDAASKEKLTQFFGIGRTCEKAAKPLYSGVERERSEKLLAQCLPRSKR